jgi:hypothetical protein
MDTIFIQLLNGLDKGAAYALIALGLTLVFGTLGVVNFAHGAIFMLGAFCAVSMQKILLLLVTLVPFCLSADGFYKWTDKRGVVHYGEEAPKNSRAKTVDMPPMTILNDYGNQWKPLAPLASERKTARSVQVNKVAVSGATSSSPTYLSFSFIAPKSGQKIKAKDGDISAMLSIKPPLKKGHKVVFIMDGKSSNPSTSRISNFTNLTAGNHALSANIVSGSGSPVMKSEEIRFSINR